MRFFHAIQQPLPFYSLVACLCLAALLGCRLMRMQEGSPIHAVTPGDVAPVDGFFFADPEPVESGQPIERSGFIVPRADLAAALQELVREIPDAPFPSGPVEHTVHSEPVIEPVPDPRFTEPDGSGGWKRRDPDAPQ